MFHNDAIGGSWTALAARPDARSTVADWAVTERALAGLGDIDGIAAAAGKLTDPTGSDAVIGALVRLAAAGDDADLDLDVVDLLLWSVPAGVDADGIRLLVATEQARAEAGCWQRDAKRVARDHGLCERTLYRRRERTLTAVRSAAGDYLAAVA